MSKYRINARVDANELQIKKDLEKMGYLVERGHDDLLVESKEGMFQFEVKKCSPFQKNGTLKIGMIKETQYIKLWNSYAHYFITWTCIDAHNYMQSRCLDNVITPALFRKNYKNWLSKKELNRLRQLGIIKKEVL